jgi:hypothetical protein
MLSFPFLEEFLVSYLVASANIFKGNIQLNGVTILLLKKSSVVVHLIG